MKTKLTMLFISVLCALGLSAQTATFTFGAPVGTNRCSEMTSWNGAPDAYPLNMGDICLATTATTTDISIPWQLGFPNNGYLTLGATYWGPLTWASGCSQNVAGCTATRPFTALNFYDGGNTTVTATVSYVVVEHTYCSPRGGCHHVFSNQVTGGSGTATNTP